MTPYIWARESDIHDKEVYSITTQVEACQARAAADGLTVAESNIYRVQKSGVDLFAIPQLADLFKRLEAETRKPKRIYCYTQDRMIRGQVAADIFYITTRFRYANAELVLVKQPKDLTTIAGQLTALVDGHAASEEVGKILDRTMRGKLQRVKQGKVYSFGREKFGHIRNKLTGKATLHPEQSKVVRQIGDWFLSGESLNECCRRLNLSGIPTGGGGKWHLSSLTRVLSDPAHCGNGVAWRERRTGNRIQQRAPGEQIPMPGVYQPIFTENEWRQIQSKLSTNKGAKTRNRKRPSFLRGFVFCALCGKPCYPAPGGGTGERFYYYRCCTQRGKQVDPDQPTCPMKAIRSDRLDALVWEAVIELLRSPEELQAIEASAQSLESLSENKELQILTALESQKQNQQANLLRQLRDAPDALAGLIKAEMLTVQAELSSATARKTELEAQNANRLAFSQNRRDAAEMIRATIEHVQHWNVEEKRSILEIVGVRVEINRPDWQISLLSF